MKRLRNSIGGNNLKETTVIQDYHFIFEKGVLFYYKKADIIYIPLYEYHHCEHIENICKGLINGSLRDVCEISKDKIEMYQRPCNLETIRQQLLERGVFFSKTQKGYTLTYYNKTLLVETNI